MVAGVNRSKTDIELAEIAEGIRRNDYIFDESEVAEVQAYLHYMQRSVSPLHVVGSILAWIAPAALILMLVWSLAMRTQASRASGPERSKKTFNANALVACSVLLAGFLAPSL